MKRLKLERILQGLSLEKLGRKAHVEAAFISMIEKGVRNPSDLTLENLARALEWAREPRELLHEVKRGDVV